VLNFLGRGSFGSVIRVFDHKRSEYSAMKIIKNSKKLTHIFGEVKMLKYLREMDPGECSNTLRIKDFVIFRNHVVIL
jgi:dual specificity tyrosine-phosphorylation-regulated kinase 2/3/4